MSIASAGLALLRELEAAKIGITTARDKLEKELVDSGYDLTLVNLPAKVNRSEDRLDAADSVLAAIQKAQDQMKSARTHA